MPERVSLTAGSAEDVAQTGVEEMLCGIWEQVLQVERVGVNDNFFDLGGHSLLAAQVVSQIRRVFGIELEIQDLFEASSVSLLGPVVEQALGRQQGSSMGPLLRAERAGDIALSYAQQRLWFLDQLEPGRSTYNIPVAVRLQGHLEVEALGRALLEVIRRHEVLRTHIELRAGRGVQVIEAQWSGGVEEQDLRGLPAVERSQEILRVASEEAERPFDLSRGPLLRMRLLYVEEQEHVLLLTMHHIVSDGWSMGLLMREVAVLYEAYAQGRPSPLPELSIQYADYAVWQREWLQGEVLEEQLGYWRKQLAGVEVLELPTDHARPSQPSRRGGSVEVRIAEPLLGRLKELSRREEMSLFMVLLTSFQLLLSRYSGQTDIAVGTPVANRTRSELEDLIGFFVNQLVLRTDLGGEPSVRELLGRVRQVCLQAYAHQDLSFERLVEEINPERSLNRTPLFQAFLALQNAPTRAMDLEGLRLEPIQAGPVPARFDLEMVVGEQGGELAGVLIYATDLYEPATVERMVGHWLRLLEQMVADPEQRISQLQMLSSVELEQVLREWNRTDAEYPEPSVQELIASQAARTPEAVAVMSGGVQLSYGELNGRANQLAHYLHRLGVGPEVRVGLCMDRSVDLVIGLLGILKAGGVYVPLDPDQPEERLSYMIEDAAISVLLTQTAVADKLLSASVRTVYVDQDWEEIAKGSDQNPAAYVQPCNGAYLIYTSGSTGRPKGVLVEHHSLKNTLLYSASRFGLGADDAVAVMASFAFDISLLELMSVWLSGGRSTILTRGEVLDVERLGKSLQSVTVVHGVPSLMRQLVVAWQQDHHRPQQLRELLTGGDTVSAGLLRDLAETFPGCDRVVLYGPTEASMICATQQITSVEGGRVSPIGRAIANTRIYVLDEDMQPVPVGVSGELYIGGAGVARGYVNRAELTACKFVPDPFGGVGERLYRSGDIGRWRGDGQLEFVGRADEQVKIRGYRIEPGEVEGALRELAGVQDAVVVAREDEPGQKRLVAYLVSEEPLQREQLREQLGRRLPEYMVPSLYVRLEALPLTGNGKLDRQRLPVPERASLTAGSAEDVAQTGVEEMLCGIWEQVLQVERVGVSDNFFDLGGHSLLAAQVVSQIRRVFGIELEIQDLFEASSVSLLGPVVEQALGRQQGSSMGRCCARSERGI